jgi:glycosyltransferase involved in cell wall biosynthesis
LNRSAEDPQVADAPRVTVIIPTRNRAHVLRSSIDSVLAQTERSLEVIVVDDASDDETARLVSGIDDSRLRYFRCPHQVGAPTARNIGIEAARGQYLAFQDSDDEWLPTKLERQLELLERRAPLADVATCGTVRTSRDGVERVVVAADETLSYEGLLGFGEPPWSGPTILVRRTPATRTVLFDEKLPSGQDWDFVVRLAQVTRIVSVREPLVRVRRAAGDRIGTLSRKLEGRKLILHKYRNELRRYPDAHASHEERIGVLSIYCGEYSQGRRHLLNALRLSPFRVRGMALPLGSFFRRSVTRRFFGQRPLAAGLS